ncbi:glycine--tRNA ligase subunit beta [Legionella sp. CNM-4043-24]|uniref:glycine--tRNA ligase subunit beta n=1 Tax=Legionella sp. CNM-4043-24 TaxID=3421646 RepID=UPI00403AC880
MVNDFLFELGCEELPSGAVKPLAEALQASLIASLDKAQLAYESIRYFAAPRRLAIQISGLQAEQASQTQQRRGPALAAAYDAGGQPTPALKGFARSCGVELDALSVQKTDKGEWLVYDFVSSGVKSRDLLPGMVQQAIASLPISKPMRWGSGDVEFVRPVHWAVMLLGDEVLDCEILGLKAGNLTRGHRFHAPENRVISHPRDYENTLFNARVIADFAKRRTEIVRQINELARQQEAEAIMPDELLDEVTSIVEWPQALLARFEPEFLDVPAEALIASMQSHQKCFALRNAHGILLPCFITVSNLNSNNPQQVISGNEKVMRARLSDAAFFFNQDKKQALSFHIAATAKVVFQLKLGTLLDKATRVGVLMRYLAEPLNLDMARASRAAELSKCDLMTGMVGEFPELQGLMGYYYATHDGEDAEVARALHEQYLPRFAADSLPEGNLGTALSLADRIDTLVGIFAIGQKPGGDKDPFKLRRHALALARLLISIPAPLHVTDLINEALAAYGNDLPGAEAAVAELHPFIMERLLSWYQGQGIGQDIVLAVRARQDNALHDLDKRVRALAAFVSCPEAAVLSAACKRVNNLLQHGQVEQTLVVNESLLEEPAEQSLFKALVAQEQSLEALYKAADYTGILTRLSTLREPVDAFFDQVMVMVDDERIKKNRLALLSRLQALLQGVADISLLQA